jgi:hypothetical protein
MPARPRWSGPAQLPPWLGALAMVGAILLAINLVPTLAAAITADTAGKAASSLKTLTPAGESTDAASDSADGSSANATGDSTANSTGGSPGDSTATRPAARENCPPASRAAAPGAAANPTANPTAAPQDGAAAAKKAAETARTFGVDPSTLADRHAAVRAALGEARAACVKPLPRSGGSIDGALLAAILLAAGLALLTTIGFTTDRPWPGRYVRRTP